MQNKIKLVMDDEKILHDGIYDLNSIYSIIDDLLVNRKGLRKDGSFYIDDNPSDSADGCLLLGCEVAIPEGYFGALAIRSSLACKHGLMLANSLGIIDSCYRGPVKAKLVNIGRRPYTINPGDRIAQLLIIPCVHATFIQVDELPESDRGTGGFGSTGAQ